MPTNYGEGSSLFMYFQDYTTNQLGFSIGLSTNLVSPAAYASLYSDETLQICNNEMEDLAFHTRIILGREAIFFRFVEGSYATIGDMMSKVIQLNNFLKMQDVSVVHQFFAEEKFVQQLMQYFPSSFEFHFQF